MEKSVRVTTIVLESRCVRRCSREMLGALIDNAESILDTLEEILSTSSVSSIFTPTARETTATSTDKKSVRFQTLLFPSLFMKLKEEPARRGLSMNEIVGQALTKELLID